MNEHWRYFQALEEDLQECTRYVHFTRENFDTYSTEFARLLLSTASEFDTIAKCLCREIRPECNVGSRIGEYRDVITSEYPRFPELEIHLPRYDLSFKPWLEWENNRNPEWWEAYNAVKHERNQHFDEATLGSSLSALSGLLAGLMYWFRETGKKIASDQAPKLYRPEQYDIIAGPDKYWNYDLPGDPERRKKMQRTQR
ncbi:hypothetical protein BSZ35_00025 [Salinibacter sp. 10B]|uniref:hypothetical protein n=1 Tax=Salinibacter sp. 10B TaxID=1923971 RepID=UPI000CF40A33|nr:hypothetical protein [Salinibacter sp. 10B]PQJ36776.1 hypothetical protein BSZ35_00025 [Salinibacter sp. 10B]